MARSRDAAPRRELQVKTAPVDDDGRFGRLALILPDGQRVSISQPLTIGTADDVDVRIDDISISRRHCIVEPREDQVVVRDLGSTNGTQVNGVRVASADLRPSAVITLGMSRLRVVMDQKIDAEIVGESAAMQALRANITRYAVLTMPTL